LGGQIAILVHATSLRTAQENLPGRLFPGVGEDDSASMTCYFCPAETQLATRSIADLHVVSRLFPDRNHYDVVPDAYAVGLRSLFRRG
jgi:hypothetical protein